MIPRDVLAALIFFELGDGVGWTLARLLDGNLGAALFHVVVSALAISVLLLLRSRTASTR